MTKFDDAIRKFFEKIGKSENKKIYDKHVQRFNTYAEALGGKKLDDDFDTVYKNALKDVHEGISEGKKVWSTLTEGFKKTDDNSTFLSRIKNGFITMWENGSKELITDENIRKVNTESGVIDVYQKHSKGINLPDIGDLSHDLYSLDAQTKYTARGKLIQSIQYQIKDKP